MGRWLLVLLAACADPIDFDGDGITEEVDCNDEDARIYPGAPERCDGVDNDCDGLADDEDDALAPGVLVWFADVDGDGFGGTSLGQVCEPPPGALRTGEDCDDGARDVRPGALEVCDGVDNDCDGLIDDADDSLDVATTPTFYRDADGDGFGGNVDLLRACAAPEGYVAETGDCDDSPEGGASRYPGAPEICDGVDNDCDIDLIDEEDPDLVLDSTSLWYRDQDGDGFGDATTGVLSCSAVAGRVQDDTDCNDRDRNNFPGNPEVCDSRDNDCDGLADDAQWWDPAWPYRVQIEVDGGSVALDGPPMLADVNLATALVSLGDPGSLDADSLRLVRQSCTDGFTEVPFDYIDGVVNLLGKGSSVSPAGDGIGTIALRYDEDGALGTLESLGAGQTARFALYFGSSTVTPGVSAATWPRGITTAVTGAGATAEITVQTGLSTAVLAGDFGGLIQSFGLVTSPDLLSQTDIGNEAPVGTFGNGIFFGPLGGGAGGGWASAASADATLLQVQHAGVTMALTRATGSVNNAHGGLTWLQQVYAFAGRPELYVRVTHTLDRSSNVGVQNPTWSSAVRPLQIDHLGVGAVADAFDRETPAFRWAWAGFDGGDRGFFAGWRVAPLRLASPASDARFLLLAGQDYEANPATNQTTLPAGSAIVNGSTFVLYPHEGARAAAEPVFQAIREGVEVRVLPADAAP